MSADSKAFVTSPAALVVGRLRVIAIILTISSGLFSFTHSRPVEPVPHSHLPGATPADIYAKDSVVGAQILTGYTILIPATINRSHAYLFILDTGASRTTISKALAHEVGLSVIGKSMIGGAGKASYSVDITHATLQAGGVMVTGDYLLYDLVTAEEILGTRLGGILGLDFFRDSVLEIDYANARVVTHAPATYHYSGPGKVFNQAIRNLQPLVTGQVRIGGHGAIGLFELDSGANQFTAVLNAPFAHRYKLRAPAPETIYVPGFAAIGGEIGLSVERGDAFQFDAISISRPILGLLPASSGFGSRTDVAGVLGGDFMRRFTVILDGPNQRIVLEPNGDVTQPSKFDNSGVVLRATGAQLATLQVYKVVAGSPGAQAGLCAGDIIDAVDRHPFANLTVDRVRTMFQQNSGDHELAVTRGKYTRIVHLRLRPLL